MGGFKYLLYTPQPTANGSVRFDVACPHGLHDLLHLTLPIQADRQMTDAAGKGLQRVTYTVPAGIAREVYARVKIIADDYFGMSENSWLEFSDQAIA